VQDLKNAKGITLRELTLAAIAEFAQPISAAEICAFLNQELNAQYQAPRFSYLLDALVEDKEIFCRTETSEERIFRGNGAKVTLNKPARLYSTYSVVPPRTVVEIVPGVILKGVDSPRAPKSETTKKYNPRQTRKEFEAKAPARKAVPSISDNSALDFLIEKLVSERTAELQRKLDEAQSKIEQFKKLLS
jgi:hypothetical protein